MRFAWLVVVGVTACVGSVSLYAQNVVVNPAGVQAGGVSVDASGKVNAGGVSVNAGGMSSTSAMAGAAGMAGDDKSFVNADLDGHNFAGRNLSAAEFVNVSARKANFQGANLEGASFTNADLAEAIFREANLRKVKMVNTDHASADFSKATWFDGRKCADNSIGRCR